jgi:3(or 17)beta-hydroxysteroid dehydrogenase
MRRVQDKVALVTGGASGIGEGIARLLASEGARVFITDLNVAKGPVVAERIGAVFLKQDVTVEAEWAAVIDSVTRQGGGLDILVNNAGLGNVGAQPDPENTTLDDWRLMMKVNGEGVFLGCRAAISAMKAKGGVIINISSIAALLPTPHLTAYGFSKAGVAQLSRSVALHCAQMGYRIRCNSIHPGEIQTPMLDGLFERISKAMGCSVAQAREDAAKAIPLKEFGTTEDIAYGVLYLVSDEGRHVTGQQLVIDGGLCLNH